LARPNTDSVERSQPVGGNSDELVLRGTAANKGAVGYGDAYDFQIGAVVAGELSQPAVLVTVLARDKDAGKFLAAHLRPAEIEIRFARAGNDEPYQLAAITGFVDESRTSWAITQLRAL
jgi:hypothetical protein